MEPVERLRVDRDGDLWIRYGGHWFCIWQEDLGPRNDAHPYSDDEIRGYGLAPITEKRD